MSIPSEPLSVDSVLGDSWVARIKAEHERLGPNCPCGNHPSKETTVNIEARALGTILIQSLDASDDYASRERAAEARAGGRALTEQLAHFGGPSVSREMMASDPTKTWHYHIDPSGSYGWDDPRRGPESRESWRRVAQSKASGEDDWGRTKILTLTLAQAEAMLDWPAYREALKPQVYVNVSGGIAEAHVTRGEADVIEHDWDNLNDGGINDYTGEDLRAMREKLSQVAAPAYRDRLLADFDEVVDDNVVGQCERCAEDVLATEDYIKEGPEVQHERCYDDDPES